MDVEQQSPMQQQLMKMLADGELLVLMGFLQSLGIFICVRFSFLSLIFREKN